MGFHLFHYILLPDDYKVNKIRALLQGKMLFFHLMITKTVPYIFVDNLCLRLHKTIGLTAIPPTICTVNIVCFIVQGTSGMLVLGCHLLKYTLKSLV